MLRSILCQLCFALVATELAPLPVSFGPASVPYVLAIHKVLQDFRNAPEELQTLWSRYDDEYDNMWHEFIASCNMRNVTYPMVERMVIAWMKKSTLKKDVVPFIDTVRRTGLPAIGKKVESKVIAARQAKKWIKASQKLRQTFTTIADYRDSMLMVQFDYLQQFFTSMGTSTSNAAKVLEKAQDGQAGKMLLHAEKAGILRLVPSSEAPADSPSPKEYVQLLRYVAYYTCRETSPPTMLTNFSSALTGWAYGVTEERILTAMHYPIFQEQLDRLTQDQAALIDSGKKNELLDMQIHVYQSYLDYHHEEYMKFLGNKNIQLRVGGAGRVSAEVSRDVSKIHGVKTIAINHRLSFEDLFDEGQLKKSFSNFMKELAKDPEHLPVFETADVQAKYMKLYEDLRAGGANPILLGNLNHVLKANGAVGVLDLPGTLGVGQLKLSPNFMLTFGQRGDGDIVYGNPTHYQGDRSYVPSTMDDQIAQHIESILLTCNRSLAGSIKSEL